MTSYSLNTIFYAFRNLETSCDWEDLPFLHASFEYSQNLECKQKLESERVKPNKRNRNETSPSLEYLSSTEGFFVVSFPRINLCQ